MLKVLMGAFYKNKNYALMQCTGVAAAAKKIMSNATDAAGSGLASDCFHCVETRNGH